MCVELTWKAKIIVDNDDGGANTKIWADLDKTAIAREFPRTPRPPKIITSTDTTRENWKSCVLLSILLFLFLELKLNTLQLNADLLDITSSAFIHILNEGIPKGKYLIVQRHILVIVIFDCSMTPFGNCHIWSSGTALHQSSHSRQNQPEMLSLPPIKVLHNVTYCQNWTLKYILSLKTFYETSAFFLRLMLATLVVVELNHSIRLTPGSVLCLWHICFA